MDDVRVPDLAAKFRDLSALELQQLAEHAFLQLVILKAYYAQHFPEAHDLWWARLAAEDLVLQPTAPRPS